MMSESELHRMYQAWQQDNDHYVRDWVDFVEWAAKWNNVGADIIIRELQKYYWFIRPENDNN